MIRKTVFKASLNFFLVFDSEFSKLLMKFDFPFEILLIIDIDSLEKVLSASYCALGERTYIVLWEDR